MIFGEVLFDIFSDGSTVLGGAPFNVAWHLQAWGLDTAGLQMDSIHPTGTVEVKFYNGEPVFEIVDNRAYDHIQPDTISSLDPALLYHGTLAVRNRTSA